MVLRVRDAASKKKKKKKKKKQIKNIVVSKNTHPNIVMYHLDIWRNMPMVHDWCSDDFVHNNHVGRYLDRDVVP